ncbi:MAG: RNA polymerase sigma factor [Planctomycetota bacterium]|jgi:RNA polymerase sigma-70 factor (ECF subfamily)
MDQDILASLVERAKQRDPEAFDLLVDQYGPRLYGYLYRLTGSRDDADDLLQDLFVRLVRMIGDYDHVGRFEAWIFRIATNLARDRVRRARRAPVTMSLDQDVANNPGQRGASSWQGLADISGPAPDAPMALREDVDKMQGALGRLPAAEREVILLRHFSGMSFAEIAQAMGTPLGTALARSHRGLGKLREMMESAA